MKLGGRGCFRPPMPPMMPDEMTGNTTANATMGNTTMPPVGIATAWNVLTNDVDYERLQSEPWRTLFTDLGYDHRRFDPSPQGDSQLTSKRVVRQQFFRCQEQRFGGIGGDQQSASGQ